MRPRALASWGVLHWLGAAVVAAAFWTAVLAGAVILGESLVGWHL